VILIEIFPRKEREELVGDKRPAQRAAELFAGKARRGSRSKVAGNPCRALWRKKKYSEPCTSFDPDFVATLMMLEEERPTSAVNLVAI
jgi:hypothetical protein